MNNSKRRTHGEITSHFVPKENCRRSLYFKRTEKGNIEIFNDADWVGSITDSRFTSEYCTYVWETWLFGNLVIWRSKRQTVVARCSAEAEFRVMACRICEGMWLKHLLDELKVPVNAPINMLYDN